MNLETFKQGLKEIQDVIAAQSTEDRKPIEDGPIDPQIYLKSKYKILWLLKEAYDNENDAEGGWSLTELLRSDDVYERFFKSTTSKRTWYPMVYVSYGILNDFMPYDDMAFIYEDPMNMTSVLKNIAFININKLAGESTSKDNQLKKIFSLNKNILKKQIDLLDPDIVIGGHTLDFYADLLELPKCNMAISEKNTKYYFNGSKLYIAAYHPGRIGISRYKYVNEDYIEDIISIAKVILKKQ